MRNECQDVLITARALLRQRDFAGSLAQGQRVLNGQKNCRTCPYGESCWGAALTLMGEALAAQAGESGSPHPWSAMSSPSSVATRRRLL